MGSKRISGTLMGCDVEYALQDKITKKFITAEGIVKGSKEAPFKFDALNKFYATSLDCTSMEGNIPPCKNEGEFYLALQHLNRYMQSVLPENLETKAVAVAEYDEDQLVSDIAQTYGCAPAYNIWNLSEVRPHPDGSNKRVMGFHIHVGYDKPNFETNVDLGKAMDLYLGVPSILIEPENDRRKSGYGLAGSCRFPSHGCEYRTLSSHFASTEELIKWCFRNTEEAIKFVNEGNMHLIENMGEDIQHIINHNDKEMAKQFIEQYNIPMI